MWNKREISRNSRCRARNKRGSSVDFARNLRGFCVGFARNLILFLFEREREGYKRFAACTVLLILLKIALFESSIEKEKYFHYRIFITGLC